MAETANQEAKKAQELNAYEIAKQRYPELNGTFWTYKDIKEKTTLGVQTIKDRMHSDPNFPRPIQYSKTKKLWRAIDILAYIESFALTQNVAQA